MYKRYCDRCNKEIPNCKNHVEIRLMETFSSEEFSAEELDLCDDCNKKFKLFMAGRSWDVLGDPVSNKHWLRDAAMFEGTREKQGL